MEKDVKDIVALASVIMAALLLVLCFCTAAFAVAVSNGIVRPVNQLIDVVHSLYTMDFSKHVSEKLFGNCLQGNIDALRM